MNLQKIKAIILLPSERTEFEEKYLKRTNSIALKFFFAHLPVMMVVAWLANTGVLSAFLMTSALLLGPALASWTFKDQRMISLSHGFTSMCLGGLLVHFGQGPMQIEMHFYFFALLAMLSIFANPMVNIVAALTVAAHHLLLYILLPSSVFNYDASIWVVMVHALFVVLETPAAVYLSRTFFDNVIGLEKIVQARTEEVHKRSRDMRLILNNVSQGFVSINLDGKMSIEKSAILQTWFGDSTPGQSIQEYLPNTHDFRDWFELGLDSVNEGALPLEVCLEQLPSRLEDGDQTFQFSYSPIVSLTGELEKILVVVSNITESLTRKRVEAEQKEIVTAFGKIMTNKVGFLEFYNEAETLVSHVVSAKTDSVDMVTFKRELHTLKGNSAIFGLTSISEYCQALEDHIEETQSMLEPVYVEGLQERWNRIKTQLNGLLGARQEAKIEIDDQEYENIVAELVHGRPREEIIQRIKTWRLEPLDQRLQTLGEQAQALATRLGKPKPKVRSDSHGVRIASEQWAGFWSAFVHVVRNAVDHGIESKEERSANGKEEAGEIRLETFVRDHKLVIEVQDDGRGVDWGLVNSKADLLGLAHDTTRDLQEAIFADGLSTKESVTSISGRGVGMAALKEECIKRQGEIAVRSEEGQGTVFQFRFPLETFANEIAW